MNQQPPTPGVNRSHEGQIVDTAGWVRVVWAARDYDVQRIYGKRMMLPPGLRMILKKVEGPNAWCYRTDIGVVMFPATLVDPWSR